MRLALVFVSICSLALLCVARAADIVATATVNFVVDAFTKTFASAPFLIDNGHPRSPLASMRAGLA